jgi:hypothetical protein
MPDTGRATSNRVRLFVVTATAIGAVVWARNTEEAREMAEAEWLKVMGLEEKATSCIDAGTDGVVWSWYE